MFTSVVGLLAAVALLLLGLHTVQPQSGESSGGSGICTNGEIRLVNGTARFEGRVELCNGSVWKTVYGGPSYYWTRNDSYVVCRQVLDQLGEELNGAITRRYQYFGKGGRNQLVYVYNRVCNGNETAYTLCEQENYRIGSTDDHTNDIGVTCIPANTSLVQECVPLTISTNQFQCQNGYCLKATTTPSSISYSLRGGPPGVCDSGGNDDCGDCSDECHCSYRVGGGASEQHCRKQPTNVCICSESEFRCSNGYCVDMSNYCDGYDNCGDSSDEFDEECREQRARNIGRTELAISLGIGVGGAVILVLIWLAVFGVCMFVRSCPLRKAFSEEPIVTPADSATNSSQTQETLLSSTSGEGTLHNIIIGF